MSDNEKKINEEVENEALKTEEANESKASEDVEEEKKECCKDKNKDKECAKKSGKKCKDKEIEKLKGELDEVKDNYQRLFAEFQNFRKRSEKEKSAMFTMGASDIIEKMLPVMDNLERGVTTLSEEDLKTPTGEGLNMIFKQMQTVLEDLGVEAIDAEGCEFDPDLHNAVMHEENDELGENVVSLVLQKGYKYKDTVIRHSMVKVAN